MRDQLMEYINLRAASIEGHISACFRQQAKHLKRIEKKIDKLNAALSSDDTEGSA